MFAFLRGSVARKGSGFIELDVHGVGYEIWVSEAVYRKLAVDQTVSLLTYCHIREDAFQIFGFLREEEKSLFKMLLGVTGIGPKVSLAVLSAMPVQEFGRAVLESDVNAFTKIAGVGKKTGQRIILEVKAKLGQDAELKSILGEDAAEPTPDTDDVIAALCALGCTLPEARKAAAAARKKAGADASAEELVRAALRSMAKV
jgi:Holliday junction DNA helicase RuvA